MLGVQTPLYAPKKVLLKLLCSIRFTEITDTSEHFMIDLSLKDLLMISFHTPSSDSLYLKEISLGSVMSGM